MKLIKVVCVLILASSMASGQRSSPRPIEELRYGEKTPNSISVIIGSDVKYPGKYHLPKGTGLKSVLGIVGGYEWMRHRTHLSPSSAQFGGGICVIRGDKPFFRARITKLQKAAAPDFELEEGDIIVFDPVILYEE